MYADSTRFGKSMLILYARTAVIKPNAAKVAFARNKKIPPKMVRFFWWSWRVIELLCQALLANGQAPYLLGQARKTQTVADSFRPLGRITRVNSIKKSPTQTGSAFFGGAGG